jgi:lysophospholipase L1-like esterase
MFLWAIGMSLMFLDPTRAIAAQKASDTKLPTLFLIGDSTVNNGTKGLEGWGSAIGEYFDPAKIAVVNDARGGRSSRTFLTEGLWAKVLEKIKPGDFVLMQFGHNDGGGLSDPKSRASLKGNGEETQEVTTAAGKKEIVHTYGWYLRKYISEAKAKGATPIVLSPVPRDIWKDGKVARSSGDYGKWAAEAAKAEEVSFVDLNDIIANHYEELGEEKVKTFFPQDHTHTSPEGAALNAQSVVEGLKGLNACPLCADLSSAADAAMPAASAEKP